MTALAFDAGRDRVVMFGGQDTSRALADTWEWDGSGWIERVPHVARPAGPVARDGHAMAFDPVRANVLVVGGYWDSVGVELGDTWSWNGTTWRQMPVNNLPPRSGHAMAFDVARGRLVLFGGQRWPALLSDTWEWDGSSWRPVATANTPPARWHHAMTYDAVQGRVMLFGGVGQNGYLADTWHFDGSSWIQDQPAASPPPRGVAILSGSTITRRVILSGGTNTGFSDLRDTWEWDGSRWTLVTQTAPLPGWSLAVAWDAIRDRHVVFSGFDSDTWAYRGGAWTRIAVPDAPRARKSGAIAYDRSRERAVLFGGESPQAGRDLAETWEWDGSVWIERRPVIAPPGRRRSAMAFDQRTRRCLLFGGEAGQSGLADTWEWDGTNWSQRFPARSPGARSRHQMAYDDARGRVVLFGGSDPIPDLTLGDTWEWDGTNWLPVTPAQRPLPRRDFGMAYAPDRARTILVGGNLGGIYLGDMWAWDGSTWQNSSPVAPILPRAGHGLAYDEARSRLVLHGGRDPWSVFPETLEWSGGDWVLRDSQPGRADGHMVYQSARATCFLFGGSEDSFLDITDPSSFEYGPTYPALATPFGHGCLGSAGLPTLAPVGTSRPWLGDVYAVRVTGLPATAPALLFLGFSATRWGPLPLPLDLTPLGMNGCVLLTDIPLVNALSNAGGSAFWSGSVCNCPDLLGFAFYTQALVVDPPANSFGATLSNAVVQRIGGR